MQKTILALCAATLPLAACSTYNGQNGDTMGSSQGAASSGMSASGDMTPTTAMNYVSMAGASDLYEIESSRMAMTQAQMPAVRNFAQMMVDHHTKTTQTLMAAAREAGMSPPPPMLMPMQRQMVDELRGTSGAAFDRLYLDQQRRAHDMALALHRNYAERGDNAALRRAAAAAVPIVQQHREQLDRM